MFKYIIALILVVCISTFIWLFNLYSEIKHEIDTVVNYKPQLTTQFFDKNGKLVANIFANENREYVKYEDIPARVIESLVAIEDTQFFEHFGINPDAISRAMIKNIKAGTYVEGASTLTQQLIKMLVLTREKKLIRKIKEALLAIKLENTLTKEEILERYLNHVYFGHGYYGIKTASKGYFKKELYELTLKEIAILVGLPRAPSFYDPTKNLKISLARANQVIARLNTLGWINEEQYTKSLKEIPQIYNQTLTQNSAPYVIDYVSNLLKDDLNDLRFGGYKIYLTIDLEAQNIAKDALKESYENALLRDLDFRKKDNSLEDDSFVKELNGALVSMESSSGKILALVGGVDYYKSMYNRAVQAKRQPGSAIKPFLYQIALNEGYNPQTLLADISRSYNYEIDGVEKKWQPKNYGENFRGEITLRDSLKYSRNLSTINLVTDIGINTIRDGLISYGFNQLPNDLSISLGTMSVNLLEFSEAFSMFSNSGIQVKPYIIDKIINAKDETIFYESSEKIVNSKEQTYLITSILQDVISSGTATRARVKGIELAGKTGTTNNNVDAWFCGYSPSIQTIIWFGNDNNLPMRKSETGGVIAAPVFSHFFKKYLELYPEIPRNFVKPENVNVAVINGKNEFYTKESPLPEVKIVPNNTNNEENEELEF